MRKAAIPATVKPRAKTPQERGRARTIKDALEREKKGGPPVTREAREWYRRYKATMIRKPRSPVVAKPAAKPEPAKPEPEQLEQPAGTVAGDHAGTQLEQPAGTADVEPAGTADVEPDDDDDDDDDDDQEDDESGEHTVNGRRTITFDDEHALAKREPENDAPICSVPNCPKCKAAFGAQRCGSTGDLVWEPMDDDTTEAMAEGLLAALGFVARIARPDHARVEPTDRELAKMKKAMRKIAHRRANALGEYDDLLLAGFTVVAYGKRALTEPGLPPPKEERDEREETRERAAAAE